MSKKANDDDIEKDRTVVTPEVGEEGGTSGDVELAIDQAPATGSEAGETWRPTERTVDKVARDETGAGRRSP